MDLDAALSQRASGPLRRPFGTVEIVGPPGAGKTSLLSVLAERHPELRPVYRWRRLRLLPAFARDSLELLPFFVDQWRARQPLPRRDMERMVRLQTSRRVAAGWTQQLVVMDQGPIYTLATLQMRASRPAGRDAFDTWRNRVVQEWAGLLDTVIYLEASDDVLLRRIADRSKPHRLRSCIDADALRWLAQLRDALEQTVERFRAYAALSVLRFDTGDQELACIADRIGAELDRRPHRAGRI